MEGEEEVKKDRKRQRQSCDKKCQRWKTEREIVNLREKEEREKEEECTLMSHSVSPPLLPTSPLAISLCPPSFQVVTHPTSLDIKSWPAVAAEASLDQVLDFMRTETPALFRNELRRILWRLKDAAAFESVIAVLVHRGIYDDHVWYGGRRDGGG